MSNTQASTLEEVIRRAGEDWLIDWFSPPSEAMNHLTQTLHAVNELAQERLAGHAPDLSEEALAREYERNPQHVKAFLQTLGGTRTPAMLLMAWRIIQGMEIEEFRVEYQRQQRFTMRVVLRSPHGDPVEEYDSDRIQDFSLLRHLGTLEAGPGRPIIDGFYPLRRP